MTLCINQVPVDFTLEAEATLADLEASLRSWAQTQGLSVLSLLADGRATPGAHPLEGVSRVDVEVVAAADEPQARLEVLAHFLDLVDQAAATDPGALDGLRPELPPVIDALGALGLEASHLEASWDRPEALAKAARGLRTRLGALTPGSGPAGVVVLLDGLEGAVAAFTELSGLFQKGRDREAFDRILAVFTDLMGLGVAVESVLANGENRGPWDEFQGSLRPFLHEAEAAMEAQDFVLLTDLLEYEVGPRILELRPLLSTLFNLDPRQGVL